MLKTATLCGLLQGTQDMARPTDHPGVTGRRAFTSDGSSRPNAPPFSALELARIVSLSEAAKILGISEDGLRRHYSHLFRRLSPRRVGIRLRDVLEIGTTDA
jgi:hypothetical protein